jgi:hypothetical protein
MSHIPLKREESTLSVNQATKATLPAPDRAEPSADSMSKGKNLYSIEIVSLIGTLGAVIAGPLLGVLAFWLLLRRYTDRHGPLFRVEFAGAPLYGRTVPVVPPSPAERPAPTLSDPPIVFEAPAEAFDLGPTYADVIEQKHQALRRQDEGILRHFVDQNLKLMEQIGELETVGHS